MPKGASIASGDVNISGSGTNHMVIDQKTNKSIINWNSFSIHSGGRVDFNQPSSKSFSLNRVQGSTPSSISGSLNSNGKVMLINPNGVAITPKGVVKTGSFTASTLDINNKDFLQDNFKFEGESLKNGIINEGKITIGGGHAALLGGYVSNSGIVTAKLGKIVMGAGKKITLDFVGDGLMSISIPVNKLSSVKDIKGRTLKSLISNNGTLKAEGGLIHLSANTAKTLSRSSVNLGTDSVIIANNYNNKKGSVILGGKNNGAMNINGQIDVSGKTLLSPSGSVIISGTNINQSGRILANGRNGGKIKILSKKHVDLNGSILAQGKSTAGGEVVILSENSIRSTPKTLIDVSGRNKGGTIRSISSMTNYSSGKLKANSQAGYGGNIDLTSEKLQLVNQNLEAKGNLQGGKIRIGGDYLGGKKLSIMDNTYNHGFKYRFGKQDNLKNAGTTLVDSNTKIDVSSAHGQGGAVVIWSNKITEFDGTVNATGNNSYLNKEFAYAFRSPPSSKITKHKASTGNVNKAFTPKVDKPTLNTRESISKELSISTFFIDKGGGNKIDSIRDPPVYERGKNISGIQSGTDPPSKNILVENKFIDNSVETPPPISLDKGGGFVEISSANYLKRANILGVSLNGGALLLDPRNIIVNSSGTRTVSQVSSFSNGSSSTYYINASTIADALTAGTSVTLQANRDITVNSAILATGSSGGNLTMQAGRDIVINSNITTANGDLTLVANETNANGVIGTVSGSRDIEGTGAIDVGTGSLSITMSNNVISYDEIDLTGEMSADTISVNSSGGNIRFGNQTANSINIESTAVSSETFVANNLTANNAGVSINISVPNLSNISALNTPSGNWRIRQTRNLNASLTNIPAGDFIQYAYSGGSILGSGNAVLSAYNPGNITRVYSTIGGLYNLTKIYDATTTTASATFASNTISGTSSSVPLNVTTNISSPTFTYSQSNVGNNLTVTADTTYTINPTHSRHGTVYGLSTSGSAATLNGRITRKNLTVQGSRFYDSTSNMYPANFSVTSGLIGSETLNFGGSNDTFSTMVADESALTAVSLNNVILADGSNGGLADNYFIQSGTFQIKKRPLAVLLTKQYDGTANFDSSNSTFFEFQTMSDPPSNSVGRTGLNFETLSLSGTGTTSGSISATGTYDVTGLSLADAIGAASNYTISGNIQGKIEKRILNLDGQRASDGSTSVLASSLNIDNLIGSETLNLSGTGTAAQSAPGNNISVDATTPGFALSDGSGGGLESNYTLTGGTHTVDITATSPYITGTKEYDGSLTIHGSLLSLVDPSNPGASVTISGSGTASSANVANGITITQANLGTLSLGGADAGNYNIGTIASNSFLTVDISPKTLNLSGSREYSGARTVNAGDLILSGNVGSETVTLSGTGELNFGGAGSRSVADISSLSLGDGTNGGLGANYTLTGGNHSFTVNPRALNITGGKVYDGDKVVHRSSVEAQINNLVVGENVLWTGYGLSASEDVGTQTVSQNTWQLSDQTHPASNYTFSGATMEITISPREVLLTMSRDYDGTTDVNASSIDTPTLTAQGSYSLGVGDFNTAGTFSSGQLALNHAFSGSNRETLTLSGIATSNSKDSGVASSVTNGNLGSLVLVDGINDGEANNYTLTLSSGDHIFTVDPKPLSLSGSKVYDGTSVVSSSELSTISGLIGSETVVLSGSTNTTGSGGSQKNVANNVSITSSAAGISLSNGSNGGLASNYTLTGGTHQTNITQKDFSVDLTRQYDGTDQAKPNSVDSAISETFNNLVSGETLTLGGTHGTVSSQEESSGIALSVDNSGGGLTISDGSGATSASGGLANNYNLTGITLTIDKRILNTSGSRDYNASSSVNANDISLNNLVSGELLNLSGSVSTSSQNAGSYSISDTSSLTISDNTGQASNYTLSGGTHNFTISRKAVNITGSRQYDASTNIAHSVVPNASITNTVNSETLTLTGGVGTTTSANVGTYELGNSSEGTLVLGNGTGLASNYTLTGGTQTYTIIQRVLNSSGSKIYDANTDAIAANITLSNLASSETLNHSGTASIGSANAGSYTITNLSGVSIADGSNGGLASNYTLTGGTHNFTVNQRAISLSGTRLYDATTNATASDLSTMANLVGSETLTLSGTGSIASANVSSNKTVTTGTLALADGSNGGLAANYTLSGGTHQLTVNQRPLIATLARQYDATTTAAGSDLSSFNDLQGGETLSMTGSGTATSANVANSIAMANNGTLALADGTGLASNYSLNSTIIDISQRVLNSSGSKIYDANTDAIAANITLSNLASSETLNHSGTASIGSANAGSYTITNLSGVSIADGSNGGLASNYTLTGGTHNFTVNQRAISLSGTRLYDATTNAAASDLSTMANLVGSETLTLSGTGSIASANVSSNKTVTTGTLALADGSNGGLAANYTLSGGTHQLTVNQRPLIATLARQYDATTTAAGSDLSSFNDLQGGETLSMTGSGTATSANVANSIAMANNGTLALADGTGLASNYSLNSTIIDISQRVLNSSGSKIYDANTDAIAANITLSNLASSETLNHSGTASIGSANAGSYTITNLSGVSIADGSNGGLASNYTLTGGTHNFTVNQRPLIATLARQYDATTTAAGSDLSSFNDLQGGETLSMTGSGTATSANVANSIAMANNGTLALADGTGLASNYSLNSTIIDISQRVLNSSGSKIYDANTDAIAANITLSNLASSETLNHSGTASIGSANAGSYTITNLSGVSIADGSNGGLASNYTLTGGTHNFTVNQRAISLSGTRLYDATTNATASDLSTMANLVGSETLTLSGTGSIASANVSSNKTVTTGTLALADGSNGGLAANYTLSGGTHQLTVNQRPLIATLARQYDATTTAAGSDLSSFNDLQGGETLSMTGSGTATSANVANSIAMANNGTLALADGTGLASNYSLNSTIIDISQRVLNSSGSKIYDANTDAIAANITLSNLASSETLNHSGTASIGSANAGSYTITNLSGVSIADGSNGGLASNYTLTGGTHNFTVNQRAISLSGTRLYDATTNATASDLSTMANLVGSETLTLSGTGSIASANVSSNKTVTTGTLALADGSNGGLAANYTLSGGTHQLTVNQRPLIATLARQYDATTTAAGSDLSSFNDLQGGETLSMTGSGTATSANVANSIAMANNGTLALADGTGLASNYSLNSTVINITQKTVDTSGIRTYDAGTIISAADLTVSGEVNNEQLSITGNGSITDKNVGTGKSTDVTGLTLQDGSNGGLASNYTLIGGTHVFNVTEAPISFTGTRTYNASTNVEASNITLSGEQGGEDLTISGNGSITDKNVGNGKTANVSGLTLGDGVSGTPGDATNYKLTGGTHSFDVTQAPLTISSSREYDGTQTFDSSIINISGLQGGETLVVADNVHSNNKDSGTYTSSSSTLLTNDLNNANVNYFLIQDRQVTGNGTWANGSSDIQPTSGENKEDFIQRALELMNEPGSNMNGFVLRYTDSSKTSILSARAKNSTTNAYNANNTLYFNQVNKNAWEAATGISASTHNDGFKLQNNTGNVSNYTIASDSFVINQRAISLSGTRLYDATTNATASDLSTMANLVGSETLTLSGTGSIASANVSSNKTVTTGTLALADGSNGGLAANYTLSGGTHQLTVNQRPLIATLARQYDATTTAAGSDLSSFNDLQGGETLSMTGSGTATSANVANSIAMANNGTLALADGTGLASNYSLNSTIIDISQRVLNSSGSKIYDANTDAIAANITLSNLASSETLNHSGTASIGSANAGSYTITNLSGVSIADGSNGGLASNYTLTGGTHNFTVNQRAISLSGTRLYDATTNATASDLSTMANLVGSETLTLSGTGSIASANVSSNKTVTTGTLALADGSNGGLAANYTLSGGTHQLTVNQRPLIATLARQYDATTTAAGSDLSSFNDLQGGETLSMTGSGTATSANVANSIAMANNGTLALADGTGLASNYSLNSTIIDISQRVLNSSGSKIYDANTDAIAANITLSNLASSETLNHSGTASIGSANAGSYTITNLSGVSIADGSNGGLASNYTLTGGTHNFTVNQRPLIATLARQYDATTTAAGSDLSSFNDLQGGETLSMTGSGTATSANVANSIAMANNGTLALADGTGLASNYSLNSTIIDIVPRDITFSGTRVYDGTTTVNSADLTTINNLANSETLSLSGSGTVVSQNVGNNKSITNGSLALVDGTGLASNYNLTTGTYDITNRWITITGTKTYDATLSVDNSDLSMSNIISGETLSLSGVAQLSSALVGSGKSLSQNTLSLSDGSGLASNYTFGSLSVNVTKRTVTLQGSKAYDGLTTVSGSNISTISNLAGGENLSIVGEGSILSAEVGNSKTISLGTLSLADGTGGSAGLATNYSISSGTVDVTSRQITLSGTRIYNGSTTVQSSELSIFSNIVSGETLALSGSGSVATANVSSGKAVTLGTISLVDNTANASNYSLVSATLDVTERPINLTSTRSYDGASTTDSSNISLSNLINTETLNLSGTISHSSSNAGIYSTNDINTTSLNLSDGSNGGLSANYTLSGGTHSLTVTKKSLGLSGSRTYDGSLNASSSDLSLSGLVGGQTLVLSGTGTIASPNVQAGKLVSVGTLSITDGTGLSSNYELSDSFTLDVTARQITATGNKIYDGSNVVSGSNISSFSNLVGSETLSATGNGTVASSNVGAGKTVTLNTLALSNGTGSSSNYTLSGASFDIIQRPLNIGGTKVYDGSTIIQGGDISSFANIVSGETLLVSGSGSVSSSSVGSDKNLTLESLTLVNNAGLASNYSIDSGTVNISQRPVNLSGTKTYDASITANSSDLAISNLVSGETLSLSGNGILGSPAAGNQTIVNTNTLTLSDGSGTASNYTLTNGSLSMTVLRRNVNVTGSKFYDGTTTVSPSDLVNFNNLAGSDLLSLTGTGSVSSATVGSEKTVSTSGLSLVDSSGVASNYNLSSAKIDITQRVLGLDGIKAFDGTNTVSSSELSLRNLVSGESLNLSGSGTVPNSSAEMNKTLNLGTLAISDGSGGIASNYMLSAGNHTFDISQLSVNISGSREYNGTTTVDSSDLTLTNLVSGENVSLSGMGSVVDQNVGANKVVTLGTLALSGNGSQNYTLTDFTTTFEITPRIVNSISNRVYDGTNNAVASDMTLSNLVGSETLNLSGTGTVLSAAVGNTKEISIGGLSLLDNTGFANNYTLDGGTHTLDINQRPITLSASRVYDGTTGLSGDSLSTTFIYSNMVGTEVLSQSGSGSVASKDVSSNQAVTIGSLSLEDGSGSAGNYSLTSATLSINERPLNVSGSKIYDSTTSVLSSDLNTVTNLVGNETIVLSNSAFVADANVGENKSISNLGTLTIGNGNNGGIGTNYTLIGGSHSLTINKRPVSISGTREYNGTNLVSSGDINTFNNTSGGETLSVSGLGSVASASVGTGKNLTIGTLSLVDGTGLASNYSISSGTFEITQKNLTFTAERSYDGTTNVDSSNISTTFSGLIGSETLVLSGSGTVSSKNVSNGQSVTLGTISISDGNGVASNYNLTSATLNVSERVLSLSGSKVYDSTSTISSSDISGLVNLVGSETIVLSNSGNTTDANVGNLKSISSLGTLSLGNGSNGGLGSNYTLVGGTHTFNVTKRPITIQGSKFYDGTNTVANTSISSFSNTSGGETLSISGSGTVLTSAAGAGKTISLGNLTLVDNTGLASNYSLSSGTFDINERVVNATGAKVYDGTTNISGSDLAVTTGVGSEVLTLNGNGSISNANVGNSKSVTRGSLLFLDGSGVATNYSFGTVTVDITPKIVNLDGSKTYDGTTNADSSNLSISSGLIGSQTLGLSGVGILNSKNVGVDKPVGIGTLVLNNGSNGGLSSNYTLQNGSHTFLVNPKATSTSGTRSYDGTSIARGSAFSSFPGKIGSDTISLSGSGSIDSATYGSKGVTIGSLISNNSNYTISGATLIVSQRPLNLTGSDRSKRLSTDISASELSFGNLVSNETLNLSGIGSISNTRPGIRNISLGTLSFSSGTGSAANYTFSGGSFKFTIRHPLKSREGVIEFLNSMRNGGSKRMLPSKTSHRSVPTVAERVTISTPDQSITVSPCVLQNGYCN